MTNEQPAMHLKATLALGIVAASLSGTAAPAQVKLPPPPERYDVELRFRIDAGRNERIRQFLAMLEYFGSIGFEVARGTDTELMMFDPTAERLRGTIGSDRARLLLREPHVRTVLLTPAGYAPPADPSERVKVAVELERGLAGPAQQRLYVQALGRLARMGFDPAVAYDHRGYTLLRGTVPAGVLPSLLKDLRGLPTGWLLPETPYAETPEPLRNVVAVRVVEVLPEPPGAPPVVPRPDPLPPVPPDQPHLFKLDAGLRRLLAAAKGQPQALRVEVHYDRAVNMEAVGWRLRLEELSYLLKIEGVIGRTATVSVPGVELAAAIASFPEVLWVRLPHSGAPVAVPPAPRPAEEFDVLAATRVADLHRLGFRGGGVRLALIDSDFSGYAALVGKGLPERTRLIDLTTLLTPALEPYPSGGGIGHGTHCALAAALAAPSAELLLVRVDPTAPHLLETIARAARGDYSRPESVRVRTNELREEREALGRLRTAVTEEYRQAFDDFSDTPEAQQRREAARKAVEDLKRREQEHDRRSRVLARVEAALAGLDGVEVIACPLVWNSGWALDGGSPLARYLSERIADTDPPVVVNGSRRRVPPLWVQSAGDSHGQSWAGLFHDRDGNGVMEFCDPAAPLPPGRWTPELNFLGLGPFGGGPSPELPAGARLRLSVQWREPHDPALSAPGGDYYRDPITDLRLLLLHQRDPEGKTVPSDEMHVAGVSEAPPLRLASGPEYGVYERSFEVTLPAAGRYALRLEGDVPRGLLPPSVPSLPAQNTRWELRVRVFVEVLDEATAARGRAVFLDAVPPEGGVGVPGDSHGSFTVGAADAASHRQPYSAAGAGQNQLLLIKPDVLAYDRLRRIGGHAGPAHGTSLATSFAAGMSAALVNSGVPSSWMQKALQIPKGGLFVVPPPWLHFLEHRRK